MDKLSGLASKLGGNKESGSGSKPDAGKEDYLDKGEVFHGSWSGVFRTDISYTGLDAIESKLSGGKIDPQKMRSTNEKITDAGREQFEKATGKNLPDKFSN
ncbi:hypothetical protein NUU61_003445 [Penicillium alfredii]|uniref:Uncharacterized protein n=1 Tax=Penicillium alfredii TaxID=1506179 RepID=A0A9W9FTI5_9EURO|nr:uncharacterized protein NUU61_003445 [Penicillium alfredii]KAJ5106098.1 hypothetical protein NUU61_003445 [Penicillium alfredii]